MEGTLLPFAVITSQWPAGAHNLSQAALTTHQHSSFPDPAGLRFSSKCVRLLPNPSPAFPWSSASRRANWVPCCSCFNHTPVSSVPQSVQPCATFSASLEKPFYSLVVQGCRSACTYIICRYPSTFFFLGALQCV